MRTMKCCIDKAEVNHSGKDRFEVRGWIYSKKGREIQAIVQADNKHDLPYKICLLYTSPSPRDVG